MRDYGKVSPQFWIGETGKRLRKAGPEAQIVSLYLMTCPHANMIGLFYVPVMYIAHETGLGIEGATKGLGRAIEAGFCSYDEDSEMVWVHEMARFQISDQLADTDKRCKGVQNEYDSTPDNPYLAQFFAQYKSAFHMTKIRGANSDQISPLEAPSMPHASQEQEHEQEQDQEQTPNPDGLGANSDAVQPSAPTAKPKSKTDCPHQKIIELYHEILPTSPAIRDWTPARSAHLRTRWAENESRQDLDWWQRFFAYIAKSEFLTGRAYSKDRKPFCAPLDWICKSENFTKIIEGRYHEEVTA